MRPVVRHTVVVAEPAVGHARVLQIRLFQQGDCVKGVFGDGVEIDVPFLRSALYLGIAMDTYSSRCSMSKPLRTKRFVVIDLLAALIMFCCAWLDSSVTTPIAETSVSTFASWRHVTVASTSS